jgi:hypothetical protein
MYDQQAPEVISPPSESPGPVLASFADRQQRHSRGTVAIRAILVIPHLVVLGVLGIGAAVVAFIGWWAALFTGQLPGFAADFLSGYLQWQTRVYAYLYLLTDVYPPFALGDAEYPIRLAVRPGRLNRLAVLFRFILVIPAGIVLVLVSYGALIVSFVTWLIVLITGSMPQPLYQAVAATVRFQARTTGYELLLTSDYPSGLLGDDRGGPTSAAPRQEAGWSLELSAAARRLVGLFLVAGAAVLVTVVAIGASAGSGDLTKAQALSQVENTYSPLNTAVGSAYSATQACNQSLSCVQQVDATLAPAFSSFATGIAALSMPTGAASTSAKALAADAEALATDFGQLSKATSTTQYSNLGSSLGVQGALTKLSTDYTTLGTALGAPKTSGS